MTGFENSIWRSCLVLGLLWVCMCEPLHSYSRWVSVKRINSTDSFTISGSREVNFNNIRLSGKILRHIVENDELIEHYRGNAIDKAKQPCHGTISVSKRSVKRGEVNYFKKFKNNPTLSFSWNGSITESKCIPKWMKHLKKKRRHKRSGSDASKRTTYSKIDGKQHKQEEAKRLQKESVEKRKQIRDDKRERIKIRRLQLKNNGNPSKGLHTGQRPSIEEIMRKNREGVKYHIPKRSHSHSRKNNGKTSLLSRGHTKKVNNRPDDVVMHRINSRQKGKKILSDKKPGEKSNGEKTKLSQKKVKKPGKMENKNNSKTKNTIESSSSKKSADPKVKKSEKKLTVTSKNKKSTKVSNKKPKSKPDDERKADNDKKHDKSKSGITTEGVSAPKSSKDGSENGDVTSGKHKGTVKPSQQKAKKPETTKKKKIKTETTSTDKSSSAKKSAAAKTKKSENITSNSKKTTLVNKKKPKSKPDKSSNNTKHKKSESRDTTGDESKPNSGEDESENSHMTDIKHKNQGASSKKRAKKPEKTKKENPKTENTIIERSSQNKSTDPKATKSEKKLNISSKNKNSRTAKRKKAESKPHNKHKAKNKKHQQPKAGITKEGESDSANAEVTSRKHQGTIKSSKKKGKEPGKKEKENSKVENTVKGSSAKKSSNKAKHSEKKVNELSKSKKSSKSKVKHYNDRVKNTTTHQRSESGTISKHVTPKSSDENHINEIDYMSHVLGFGLGRRKHLRTKSQAWSRGVHERPMSGGYARSGSLTHARSDLYGASAWAGV